MCTKAKNGFSQKIQIHKTVHTHTLTQRALCLVIVGEVEVKSALSNSFGFGGTNGSMLLSKFKD